MCGRYASYRSIDALRTFTILTTASAALRHLHERMPVILEPADFPLWLGEEEGDFFPLMRPSDAEFRVWRVSTAVNNVRNDSASLLEAIS